MMIDVFKNGFHTNHDRDPIFKATIVDNSKKQVIFEYKVKQTTKQFFILCFTKFPKCPENLFLSFFTPLFIAGDFQSGTCPSAL